MLPSEPLLEMALSLVHEELPHLSGSSLSTVQSHLSGFIAGSTTYPEIHSLILDLTGSAAVVDKLNQILTCPDQPLPEAKSRPAFDPGGARKRTHSWTTQEDVRLFAGVHKFGLSSSYNWSAVAQFVGNGRTRSQCSQRWIRVLDPRISKDQWTPEEDERLAELVAQLGEKAWMKVANQMGNRSDVQCRYHYMQMQRVGYRRRQRPPPQPPQLPPAHDDVQLADPGMSLFLPIDEPTDGVERGDAEQRMFEITEEVTIPLNTSLDLKKSDGLFDSNLWLFRFE